MGFFRRIGNTISRFMYGRNGLDHLGMAMVWGSLLLELLAMWTEWWIVSYLGLALWGVVIFRIFSRNIYKRREENGKWLSLWRGFKTRSTGAKERRADKNHKYFTCKNCKALCRVPVGKGKIVITCPKCGGEIQGKS